MIPILASLIPTIVEKGFDLFDKKYETETDKTKAKQEYEKMITEQINNAWDREQEEITKRLQADMASDSWLSKNIRPLTLIFILVMYSLLSISSGFDFKVTQAYIELLGQWGMLIMSFYFGGRSLEKAISIWKGVK